MVAWTGAEGAVLGGAGVPFRTVADVIGTEGLASAEAAARTWARVWGRLPVADGRSLRELLEWRGASLWWMAETFVRTVTAGPLCVRTAETCLRLLERLAPVEVDASGLAPAAALLLSRACTARGVLFHGSVPSVGRPLPPSGPVSGGGPTVWRALGSLIAPSAPPALPEPTTAGGPAATPPLLSLVGRPEDAAALHPLLEAIAKDLQLPTVVVPTRDLTRWRTRRVRRAEAEAEAFLRECLARLRGTPGLNESCTHRGVGFADLAGGDLEALLLGHLPEAVRRLEAAAELIAAARPRAVLLVVASRDDRRALLTACARAGPPALVLRLGVPEPEDVDRADGGPQPLASLAWEPGGDAGAIVARLRGATRGTVEAR